MGPEDLDLLEDLEVVVVLVELDLKFSLVHIIMIKMLLLIRGI